MPPSSYNVIANSSFLDAFGALAVGVGDPTGALQALNGNTANSVQIAASVLAQLMASPGQAGQASFYSFQGDSPVINVALMLQRAAPQSTLDALLNGDWADRQTAITQQGNGIWSTYGADPTAYAATQQAILAALDNPGANPMALAAQQGYAGTAENRTIWLSLSANQFDTLFNSVLLNGNQGLAWTGPLSLPSTIAPGTIAGLWVDLEQDFGNPVLAPNATPAYPGAGPVSLGNAAGGQFWNPADPGPDNQVAATPGALAELYNFPLPIGLSAPAIALIEEGLNQPGMLEALNAYRQQLGLPAMTAAQFQLIGATGVAPGGALGEWALDSSVLAAIAPNSAQYIYGAGSTGTAPVGIFQAYQNAFFDSTRNPEVLSSSYGAYASMTAQSPFQRAWQQLFVDGVLSGVSVHIAAGDQGSSGYFTNGTANAEASQSSAWALVVGGTSIAGPFSALNDVTLGTIFVQAMQGDPATLFELVAAGLTALPSTMSWGDPRTLSSDATAYAPQLVKLIESVWNEYVFATGNNSLLTDFGANQAGSGGVDVTQPVPAYQTAFGLTPGATPSSPNGTGRGAPDVSALSSGDSHYAVLNSQFVTDPSQPVIGTSGGTSASAPLWATLTSQFNVVFKDQGLPSLGFYNDLLYIAAAIAPASFNDIMLGNNNSGFYATAGWSGYVDEGQSIQPTGVGYTAAPGYDLASGLGTPNGMLLGRALAQIAHEQMYHDAIDPFLTASGSLWQAGASESLLFQATTSGDAAVHLSFDDAGITFFTGASDSFAWTTRLAQQSLQADFDPALVTLFDGQSQGALVQTTVAQNTALAVTLNGAQAVTPQAGISTPFGFADFTTSVSAMGFNPDLRVALPVAIAETAGGADDTVAIVRLRQNGENNLAVSFFRVDDYAGTIEIGGTSFAPGSANYAAAAQARAYLAASGGTSIDGPGYGNFTQAGLVNVDAGDIIAMKLVNNTTGQIFWSFAAANETVGGQAVAHLWNYGLNTWGFEDTLGGGDRDYNDLVVGLDFISAAGHGYLV